MDSPGTTWLCRYLLLLLSVAGETVTGQQLVIRDSLAVTLTDQFDGGKPLLFYRIAGKIDYSVMASAMKFSHWEKEPGVDQILLLHKLDLNSELSVDGKFKLAHSLHQDLGLQYFFDSISRFQPDITKAEAHYDYTIAKFTTLAFRFSLTTRISNAYHYYLDTAGGISKQLQSSFLTPMIGTFSGGLAWKNPKYLSSFLGIAGGKFVYIHENQIYDELGVEKFHGVERGRHTLLDYAILLQFLVDKKLFRSLAWTFEANILKKVQVSPEVLIKNGFILRIGKYITASLQTRVIFEEEISLTWQTENILTIGFGIHFPE